MNNLEPIFKSVFGKNWDSLPEVMRKHYILRPCSNDVVTIEGKMDITATGTMQYFAPIFKLFKILAPVGKNIPVTVYLRSDKDSSKFHFDRQFHYPDNQTYVFRSYMLPMKDNIVVETMFMGVGWRTAYETEGNKVYLRDRGFVWKIFGKIIPLPMSLLFGKVSMEKEALSDDTFNLYMEMAHPLFGKYIYAGNFKITDIKQ